MQAVYVKYIFRDSTMYWNNMMYVVRASFISLEKKTN